MKKIFKNPIFTFIIGIVLTSSVVGVLAYSYAASDIYYTTNKNANVENVEQAINDLYSKVHLKSYDLSGIAVYYNPVSNTKCTDYISSNSSTGTKTGCMKWYIVSGDTNNVTMILDHNTTASKVWNSENKNVAYESSSVKSDVDDLVTSDKWKVQPRLITAQEIANITNYSNWDGKSYFYFDSNSNSRVITTQGASNYSWLFDYTINCTSYGCNIADSSNSGYWIINGEEYNGNGQYIWCVFWNGYLAKTAANGSYTPTHGIRPVITISKSILN